MFDRMGLIDPPTRRHLECLAEDVRSGDVREALASPGAPSCEPGAAYQLVQDRRQ
jgi:hypothetical protein